MNDENWTNVTSAMPEVTLESLLEVFEQFMPQKKIEIRVHPLDREAFLAFVCRAWPAGKEPMHALLIGEENGSVVVDRTRLDVALHGILVYSEFQLRGKASIVHWLFRESQWLGLPKVWEIEKIEIVTFYGEEE